MAGIKGKNTSDRILASQVEKLYNIQSHFRLEMIIWQVYQITVKSIQIPPLPFRGRSDLSILDLKTLNHNVQITNETNLWAIFFLKYDQFEIVTVHLWNIPVWRANQIHMGRANYMNLFLRTHGDSLANDMRSL